MNVEKVLSDFFEFGHLYFYMMNRDIYFLIMYFMIFSFLGWLMETVRVSARDAKFVNRGFLNGPFCPIYGFGMDMIIIFLSGFKDNVLVLGFMGMILASVLEYLTSFFMEKLFNEKWWDYSYRKLNINGRISIDISICWGILSVVMIKYVVPVVDIIIKKIDYGLSVAFIFIFFVYFVFDLSFTVWHIVSFNVLRQKLKQSAQELYEAAYDLRESAKSTIKLKYKKKFDKRFDRFMKIYADNEQMEDLKKEIREFFNDFGEKLFDEPWQRIGLEEKFKSYKTKLSDMSKKQSFFVHRRIKRAFPRLSSHKINFFKDMKRYFRGKINKN